MAESKTANNILWLLIGFMISIATIFIQDIFTKKEKTIQLYLDEKKDFVSACDIYVKHYRQWHELMNYFVYLDTSKTFNPLSEFKDFNTVAESYRTWKKDFDFAYGKIFLLSDDDFGLRTMTVSTVLYSTLDSIIYRAYPIPQKEKILQDIDNYFFENWLLPAQEEIFRYNTGNRKQESMSEFINKQQELKKRQMENDSINDSMYEGLMRTYKYIQKQDSISGKHSRIRMPNKEEFNNFVNPNGNKKHGS
jgi:hypothetical protein